MGLKSSRSAANRLDEQANQARKTAFSCVVSLGRSGLLSTAIAPLRDGGVYDLPLAAAWMAGMRCSRPSNLVTYASAPMSMQRTAVRLSASCV